MLTWIEVDLNTIGQNIKKIKKYIGPQIGLASVIKSNAYGHGLVEVAKEASKVGVEFLAVDNVIETEKIKNIKSKILILGGVESENLPWVIKNNIHFGIYDLKFAKKVEKISQKIKKKAKVHIKIDTGMHRLGFDCDKAVESIKKIKNNFKNIKIMGLWSHFADSGSRENKKYTIKQIKKFKEIICEIEKINIKIKYKHLCNSSGIMALPEAHFNLVRAGIIIYGIFPSETMKRKYKNKLKIKSALSFKTRIISLRELPKGEKIGYGLTYCLRKKSKIAVLAVGYKDGYGRSLSNKGIVIIRQKRCKVVGRICMRMLMVDVSNVRGVRLDDEAVLLGGDEHARIEADEVAKKMDTIPYEVLSRISESVPRIYKNRSITK